MIQVAEDDAKTYCRFSSLCKVRIKIKKKEPVWSRWKVALGSVRRALLSQVSASPSKSFVMRFDQSQPDAGHEPPSEGSEDAGQMLASERQQIVVFGETRGEQNEFSSHWMAVRCLFTWINTWQGQLWQRVSALFKYEAAFVFTQTVVCFTAGNKITKSLEELREIRHNFFTDCSAAFISEAQSIRPDDTKL